MKHLYLILLLSVVPLLFACDQVPEQETEDQSAMEEPERGRIVALGDSLTAGFGVELTDSYPALLQEKLAEDGHSFRVVNAGVSGETSSGTLSRLAWILSQDPDIVILVIGANDGLRGIDTVLVEDNIASIIRQLQENGVVTVLGGMKMVRNLGEQYTQEFDAIYPRLAEKFNVIFMPFFLEDVASESALNQTDGIHPNEQGYRIIKENIYPYVLQAIKQLEEKSGRLEG